MPAVAGEREKPENVFLSLYLKVASGTVIYRLDKKCSFIQKSQTKSHRFTFVTPKNVGMFILCAVHACLDIL